MRNLKEQSLATFDKILIPTMLAFLSWVPEIQLSLMLAYWFFGVSMQYKQNDVNNFVKILEDNPEIFTKEIMQTEEFKDWFVIILESYIKERNKSKKEIIKNIFLWFTKLTEKEKEEFELEKMLDILNKISEKEINLLDEIYKWKIDENIKKTVTDNYQESYEDKNYSNLKYLESLSLIIIYSDIESSIAEETEWDEEDWYHTTGRTYSRIISSENFELSNFWSIFIEYIIK